MSIALFGLAPTLVETECIIAQWYAVGFSLADISILLPVEQDGAHVVRAEGIVRLLAETAVYRDAHGTEVLVGGPLGGAFSELRAAGLTQCLHGCGLPSEHVPAYEEHLRRGHVLVAIRTKSAQSDQAVDIFQQNGGHHVARALRPAERVESAPLLTRRDE